MLFLSDNDRLLAYCIREAGVEVAINIVLANHKGGVGKSTSSMMLAEGLALFHGRRVLLLDLDPQGMLSRMMMSQRGLDAAASEHRTCLDLLRGYANGQHGALPYYVAPKVSDITELRHARDERRVDLVPSHPQSIMLAVKLDALLRQRFANTDLDQDLSRSFDHDLQRISQYYDVVLFDCPAGIQPTSLAVLRLSALVIAPTMLERNSINALVDYLRIIIDADVSGHTGLAPRVHVLMTMFLRSNPSQQLLLDTVQRGISGLNAITTPISHSTAIQRAASHPGDGATRLAREKYGAAFTEFQQLASAVNALVEDVAKRRGGKDSVDRTAHRPVGALS
jgi:chromosome partitioning protein